MLFLVKESGNEKSFYIYFETQCSFFAFSFWLVLFFIALFAILMAVESCSPDVNLDKDICLDDGNVWDYEENRCRKDCLTWNDKYGLRLNDTGTYTIYRRLS